MPIHTGKRNPYSHKYPSLTAVCHALVKSPPSGLDARTIADFLGKPYSTLMSELSGQEGHKFGADLVLPLMDVTGGYAPHEFIAREIGYFTFPLPRIDDRHPASETAIKAITEFGELMATTGAALEDGTVTREEMEEVRRTGMDAISAITNLISSMQRVQTKKPL